MDSRYSFTYKDPSIKDSFLRGCNIIADTIEKAVENFRLKYPNCEVKGVLKMD